ncbi:MAG: ankyrin repeat domain-containing protein, partial [Phyllobacterium sp.]
MNFLCAFTLVLFGASSAVAGPLHDAAKNGDLTRARQLLDQGANIADLDSSGEPALLIASLAGHKEIVALLLDRGSAIEIRNKGGLTAVHAAAYAGRLDVVKLLVSKGAAVNDNKNFY